MYGDRHNLTGRRLRLPSTRTAFYLPPLLLVVALMLAAILAMSMPVAAQDETTSTPVYQSTFTPVLVSGSAYGCWQYSGAVQGVPDVNDKGRCEKVHPGNHYFEWKGTKYYFHNLTLSMSDGLSWMISTNPDGLTTTTWPAELHGTVTVDGVKIPLTNYAYISAADYTAAGGKPWDDKTQVTVVIHGPPGTGTVIWSSTLTVDEDGVYSGCNDVVTSQNNCSSALTDNDFEYNGLTYQVEGLYYASDTNRTFLNTEPASQSRLVGLELHLGSTQVTLGASIPGLHRWENTNPQWSDGQQVAVKLVLPPSVSLEIVSKDDKMVVKDGVYQVEENSGAGRWIEIKAVMNQNAASAMDFVLRLEGHGSNSAVYDDDYETWPRLGTTFTVPQGASESATQRVKISARCDTNTEGDEAFAIKLANQALSLESNAILVNLVDNCIHPDDFVAPTPTPNPACSSGMFTIKSHTATTDSITVTYDAPVNVGYALKVTSDGNLAHEVFNISGSGPTRVWEIRLGLTPGTDYEIRLGKVVGEYEASYDCSTPYSASTLDPVAPNCDVGGYMSVKGTTSTTDSITVNWDEYTLKNGLPVEGYYVLWRPQGSSDTWSESSMRQPTVRSWTITGLNPGTNYEIWIAYQASGAPWHCGVIFNTSTEAPPLKVFPIQFEHNSYYLHEPAGHEKLVKFRCNPKLSDAQCASANVQIYVASSAADIAAGDAKHGAVPQATFDVDYEFRSNWSGAPPREWASVRIAVANDQEDEPSERFYIVAEYKPDRKKYVAVDIEDGSLRYMAFYIRDTAAKEEDRSVMLRVVCTTQACGERDHSFTIETSNKVRKEGAKVIGGDVPHATVGTDYEKTTFTRTLSKGTEFIDIPIAIMDDDLTEPDEMMFVKMTINGVENQEPRYAFITIKDGDAAALIGFKPTQYSRQEGTHPHVDLTVSRVGGPVSLPVQFTITATDASTTQYNEFLAESGTSPVQTLASQDADYKSGKFKGRLGPGENSTTVRIPLIDDDIAEPVESFVVSLSVDSTGGAVASKLEHALISVSDDDQLSAQSSSGFCQLVEQGKKKEGQCKIGISLVGEVYDSVRFSVTSSDTSAVTVNKSELTFTKDNWNKPQKVTVTAIGDLDYESEFVKVTVKATFTNGIRIDTILEVPIVVRDNDIDCAAVAKASPDIADAAAASAAGRCLKANEYMFVPTISAYGSNPQIKLVLGAPTTERLDYKAEIRGTRTVWSNGIVVGQTGAEFTFLWTSPPPPPSNPTPYQLIIYEVVITQGLDGYTQVGPSSYYLVVLPPTGGL